MMTETKVIYHIDDEETPYLVKIPISPERVTLSDFKNVLNRPNFKYFFKALDDDFGVVKEELVEDSSKLPIVNGRVVSWLVTADSSSNQSDGGRSSQSPISNVTTNLNYHGPLQRQQHTNNNNNNTPNVHQYDHELPYYAGSTCSESTISSHPINFSRFRRPVDKYKTHLNNKLMPNLYENSSTMLSSSDIDSSTIYSRMRPHMAHSECSSSVSRLQVSNTRKKSHKRRRQRMQPTISRTSSYSSITDSSMSLNIITVNLKLDKVNFLGISIVGHCNKSGDRGIYVGSIMKGGAVALDGRIEPGDMILQVNNINFETLTNDEAVKVLREVVQTPKEIKLVVAKCWNQNPKGYFTVPRMEPVRPIDTETWIAHTAAVAAARGDVAMMPRPMSRSTLSSSSLSSSLPATNELYCATSSTDFQLTINSDMITVVEQMSKTDSGLEIRDRTWLKISIPNAFIGCDVVDWLLSHVEGFNDRRDAHKYASRMLKTGYIRHTVNKHTFSEQCYYVFASDFTHAPQSNNNENCGGTDEKSNLEGGGTGNGSSGTVTTVATATTMMSALKLTPDNLSGVTDCVSLPPPPSTFRNYSNQMEYQQMEPFYNTSSEQTIYGYNHSEASNSSNERLRYSKHSLSISSDESGDDFYDEEEEEAINDGDAQERPMTQAQKQHTRNTSEMTGITANKNSSRHYLLTA